MPTEGGTHKARRAGKYTLIGVQGRKTGITVSKEIQKDADGLDDVNAFFGEAENDSSEDLVVEAEVPAVEHSQQNDRISLSMNDDAPSADEVSMSLVSDGSQIGNDESPSKAFDLGSGRQDEQIESNIVSVLRSPAKPQAKESPVCSETTDESRGQRRKKASATVRPRRSAQRGTTDGAINEESGEHSTVRRSSRQRFAPLEYWRGERLVYGRRKSAGGNIVPVVKSVVRLPQSEEDDASDGSRGKRKRGGSSRSSRRVARSEAIDEPTSPDIVIVKFGSDPPEESTKSLVFTQSMLRPQPVGGADGYKAHKMFGSDFMNVGMLFIPRYCEKPSKSSKENVMAFHVEKGTIRVTIHESTFDIGTGGSFVVPRGNHYHIENIGSIEARLFYTQARDLR